MSHYEVPAYTTNETDGVIPISRKQVGQGALAD